MESAKNIARKVYNYRRLIILILTPLLALIIPLSADESFKSESKCVFVVIIMAVYWTTEVIPLPMTAFLPALLFPPLGLISAKEIAPIYLSDVNLLFIGGLMMAVAIEQWKLHHRIALRFMLLVGTQTHWMMVGFMVPAWFLSMWISNTATTAMMVPIVGAVAGELGLKGEETENAESSPQNPEHSDEFQMESKNGQQEQGASLDSVVTVVDGENNVKESPEAESPRSVEDAEQEENVAHADMAIEKQEATALALCICYAASIGGIATLTGSPPNVILASRADSFFAEYGKASSGVTFGSWMLFALPVSLICLVIGWLWLCIVFLGPRTFCKRVDKRRAHVIGGIIRRNYDDLGPISFAEISLLLVFTCLAVLWFTRDPGIFTGWSVWFHYGKYIRDSTVAIAIGFSLFILPSSNPFKGETKPLLDWHSVSTKLPWGVVWLLGGGFALAATVKSSGLSLWVSKLLKGAIGGLPRVPMIFVLCIVSASLTEVTSNTATATMLIEILNDTARTLDLNPLMLLFPAIISCSFAFMLPAATPPNAIVFATGFVRVIDMIKAGIGMNIWCVCVSTLATLSWGDAMFDYDSKPWDGIDQVLTTADPSITCLYNSTIQACTEAL